MSSSNFWYFSKFFFFFAKPRLLFEFPAETTDDNENNRTKMSVFSSFCCPYLSHKSVAQNVWPILRLQSYVRLTSHKRRTRGPERRCTLTIRLRYSFRQARLLVVGGGLQREGEGTEVWGGTRVFAVHRWFMFTAITTHTHTHRFSLLWWKGCVRTTRCRPVPKKKRKKHDEHAARARTRRFEKSFPTTFEKITKRLSLDPRPFGWFPFIRIAPRAHV